MKMNVYIAPANHDITGFCNIYLKRSDFSIGSARDDYRKSPSTWSEVGRMNCLGQVVCLERALVGEAIYQDIMDCQPLMAGLQFSADAAAPQAAPAAPGVAGNDAPRLRPRARP